MSSANSHLLLQTECCILWYKEPLWSRHRKKLISHMIFRGFCSKHPAAVVSVSGSISSSFPSGNLAMPINPIFKLWSKNLKGKILVNTARSTIDLSVHFYPLPLFVELHNVRDLQPFYLASSYPLIALCMHDDDLLVKKNLSRWHDLSFFLCEH